MSVLVILRESQPPFELALLSRVIMVLAWVARTLCVVIGLSFIMECLHPRSCLGSILKQTIPFV